MKYLFTLVSLLMLIFAFNTEAALIYTDDFESGSGSTDSTCWASRPDAAGTCNNTGCRTIFAPICTPAYGTGSTQAVYTLQPHAAAAHSGSRALKVVFTAKEQLALSDLSVSMDTVYFGQWVYFATGYDFGPGQKIARIDTKNSGGAIVADFIILIYGATHTSGADDMGGLTLAKNGSSGGDLNFGYADNQNWTRNTWYHVECGIGLNAIGQSNGWGACWVNGTKVLETTGIGGTLLRPGGSTDQIKTITPAGWPSEGTSGWEISGTYYIDDITVSTTRVGTTFPGGGSCVTD